MTKRLEPLTHMLNSMVHADLPEGPLSALNEFIDNALGESAGNAQQVRIIYNKDAIIIADNGQGVHDLNALFRIGDSASRLSDTDIGNFGWGSKVGGLYLGWNVHAFTVRDDRAHQFGVDWTEVRDSEQWPLEYEGRGRKPKKGEVGTTITITKRHRTFKLRSMAERLAHIYGPALRNGREITLIQFDAQKEKHEIKLSSMVNANVLEHEKRFSVSVNGKTAEVRAGAMPERKGRLNGVHLSFGHRVIRTERALSHSLPPKLFVEVVLSPAWKQSLTATKNDIRFDKEELLAEVEHGITDLVELLNAETQERRLDFINAQISEAFNEAIAAVNEDEGLFKELNKVRARAGIRGKSDKPSKPAPGPNEKEQVQAGEIVEGGKDATEQRQRKPQFGLRFNIMSLGDEVFAVDPSDTSLLVTLNSDISVINKAYSSPIQGFAIWANAVHALVHWFFNNDPTRTAYLGKLLPTFEQDIEDFGSVVTDELKHKVLALLLEKAPEIKEPTTTQLLDD